MKKTVSILFILLFAGSTIAPLFAIDTCNMPCCAVEVESCCKVEKRMNCNMEMVNCETHILVMLPSAPMNRVNHEIIPIIEPLVTSSFLYLHENIFYMVLNRALIPKPPPAFNIPLLI